MATHSSTLAWKIPWMEEPGRLQSMGTLRVEHDWATSLSLFTFMHWRRKWQPTPVFLPGESQGPGSLVGCCLWGRTESDTTEATALALADKPKGFPGGSVLKNPSQCRRLWFSLWVGKIPCRRRWQPMPAFLSGEFYGQKGLLGYRLGVARVRQHLVTKPHERALKGFLLTWIPIPSAGVWFVSIHVKFGESKLCSYECAHMALNLVC